MRLLLRLAGQGKAVDAMNALREIERLEAASKLDEAREFRKRALAAMSPSATSPLWRSEGFDRLEQGDASGALEAFEAGIAHLDESPLYGVAGPDYLYYGAAVAAIQTGRIEAAIHYYARLDDSVNAIMKHLKGESLQAWTREWEPKREWLRARISAARTSPPS